MQRPGAGYRRTFNAQITAITATTKISVLNRNDSTWRITPSSSHAATSSTSAAITVRPNEREEDSFMSLELNGNAAGQRGNPLSGRIPGPSPREARAVVVG